MRDVFAKKLMHAQATPNRHGLKLLRVYIIKWSTLLNFIMCLIFLTLILKEA